MTRRAVVAAWAPAALYMAAIWVLSSQDISLRLEAYMPMRDKGIHFVEYAVLGFLVAHALLRTFPRQPAFRLILVAALSAAAWGLLDELHQAFVPGRDAELLDVCADAMGATAGALARFVLRAGARRWREAAS